MYVRIEVVCCSSTHTSMYKIIRHFSEYKVCSPFVNYIIYLNEMKQWYRFFTNNVATSWDFIFKLIYVLTHSALASLIIRYRFLSPKDTHMVNLFSCWSIWPNIKCATCQSRYVTDTLSNTLTSQFQVQ